MPSQFKLKRRIEFAETDMAGIMHFSNFLRLMEATEHAFFRSLGFSIHSEVEGEKIGWPRVKAECEYSHPLRFEEEVEIRLQIEEVRSRSVRYRFVFAKRQGDKEIEAARGSLTTVCVKLDSGTGEIKPVPIPAKIRGKLEEAATRQ